MRARRVALFALLALVALATWRARSDRDPEPFAGFLDLGRGASVRRVELGERPIPYLVVTVPRRRGFALRAVATKRGIRPLAELATSVNALAAVNGDYHEMEGFLLGRTVSTFVEGGGVRDLARWRVVGPPGEASFWLDEGREPRIGKLDVGASIGLPDPVTQGVDCARAEATLVTDPLPDPRPLAGAVAFPLARVDGGFRVSGPPGARVAGPSLVVREAALARISSASLAGTLALSVKTRVDLAIGTGPLLLANGELGPTVADERWSSHARTAVGLNRDAVFLVATIHEPHHRATMLELARAMAALGCTDALNLDGGPSTALWAGRILTDGGHPGVSNDVGSALAVVEGVEGRDDLR